MTMREIREHLGHATPGVPDPTVQPTRYVVSCLPGDDTDRHLFSIQVEYRGRDRWAVVRHGQCLTADGFWDWEHVPSERTDEWLAAHRFDVDTALRLAREAAPLITVNGFTVSDALRMHAERNTR
ncbi:hypothetical protein [Streptomyces qinglanensis]|uniref:hypothetical protein n=1 Tax=Streptomyces qinglanensis TaxID=943816 RepID=UPI003D723372